MKIDENDPYAAEFDVTDEASDTASLFPDDQDQAPSDVAESDQAIEGAGESVSDPGDADEEAAASPPSVEKKPKPVWVWIAGGMVGLVVVAGGLTVFMPHPEGHAVYRNPEMMRPQEPPQASGVKPAPAFVMSPSASPVSAPPLSGATRQAPNGSQNPVVVTPSTQARIGYAPQSHALATAPSGPVNARLAPESSGSAPLSGDYGAAPSPTSSVDQTLIQILARVRSIQKSLHAFSRPTPSAPASSLVLRLREQRDHAWSEIRKLERSREAMLHEIMDLRKQEAHRPSAVVTVPITHTTQAPITTSPAIAEGTPWAGWRLAGLSSQAVILRNVRGGIKIIQPGQAFRGLRVLTINAAQRLLMTNEGPIVLPPRA